MICLTCEDKDREKIQQAKDLAYAHAKKNGIKTMEIVKVKNGSYSWKVYGETHQHQHVEYIFI